ncbi:hypothetical protein [Arthrobacter sp. TE12232]
MKKSLACLAVATALVVIVGVGASGCSQPAGTVAPAASNGSAQPAAQSATPITPAPTAAGAKAALDAFFAQVKIDSGPYLSRSEATGGAAADYATKKAVFRDVFQKSLAFMDPSMPEQAAQDLVVAYATWFIIDPKATIATDETAFKLGGDTASVLGTSFRWNALGMSLPKATEDGQTHTVTLKATDGKWLISGYALAP